ncbi:MAG: RluA family pseudouridine synthase [Spirochaetes bacterium]|nr:RluA family pseudouridine synthase [Spirochaetota bacterium]
MNFTTDNLIKPVRLDRFISGKLDFFTREKWKEEIRDNRLQVNNCIVTNPHRKIIPGDTITYLCRERSEPEIDAGFSIIFEDENIIAVNKTGNLPVHPSGIYFQNTLVTLMMEKYPNIYLIHRLDRETSGIILAAKTPEAATKYQKSLKDAQKTYTAIVFGNFPDKLTIDMPIGFAYDLNMIEDFTKKVKKKRAAFKNAPECAETEFQKIAQLNNYSVVAALPQTGRLHQIRVHLQYAGFPIVGDKLYGHDETCYLEFLQNGLTEHILKKTIMPRCCLHASSLEITDPFSGRRNFFEALLPSDMKEFIEENRNG